MYYDYKQNTVVPQTPEESRQLLDLIEKYLDKQLHVEKVIMKLVDEVVLRANETVVITANPAAACWRFFQIAPKHVKIEHVTKEIKNHASSFIEYSTAGYTARLQRNFNFGENVNIVDLCPPPLLILPLSRTLHGILYAFQQYEKVFGDSSHGIGASYVLKYKEKLLVDLYEFCEGEHACRQITEIITQTFDINGILTLLREHDAVSTGK